MQQDVASGEACVVCVVANPSSLGAPCHIGLAVGFADLPPWHLLLDPSTPTESLTCKRHRIAHPEMTILPVGKEGLCVKRPKRFW